MSNNINTYTDIIAQSQYTYVHALKCVKIFNKTFKSLKMTH